MTDDDEVFALTATDRHSGTWLRLLKHLNDKLDTLRKNNDAAHDEVKTAHIRGQIATLKALIALDVLEKKKQ